MNENKYTKQNTKKKKNNNKKTKRKSKREYWAKKKKKIYIYKSCKIEMHRGHLVYICISFFNCENILW